MKIYITALAFCLLQLTPFMGRCTEPVQKEVRVSIGIQLEDKNDTIDDKTQSEIINKAIQDVRAICDMTARQIKAIQDTPTQQQVDQALHENLQLFIDTCNAESIKSNNKVTFVLENNENNFGIVIHCKKASTDAGYWQEIKDTLYAASETITQKASSAGSFVKETATSGAHTVASAASTIKEKTKQGLHTVASKVSEATK